MTDLLTLLAREKALVRVQSPVRLDRYGEPQPDIAEPLEALAERLESIASQLENAGA